MTTPTSSTDAAPALAERIAAQRGIIIAVGIAAVAYAIAVVGAWMSCGASGSDIVNRLAGFISGSSSAGISNIGSELRFAYAFGVGAVSAVNPCGFIMLPVYLGLYVSGGAGAEQERRQSALLIGRALMVGLVVSAGFVALFGIMGLILGFGAQAAASFFAYVGLAIGILLVGGGAFIAGGGKIYISLAQRAASRVGNPNQTNLLGYFLFGVSYGLASLSCALPLFLVVVGLGAGSDLTWVRTLGQFGLYAAGMGTVILVLTLGMAITRTAIVRWLRTALPYVSMAGAWLMIVAGAYIMFYELTLGNVLCGLGG